MRRVGQDLEEEEGEREEWGLGSEWREWRRERGMGRPKRMGRPKNSAQNAGTVVVLCLAKRLVPYWLVKKT
jgi:hypothetical protein